MQSKLKHFLALGALLISCVSEAFCPLCVFAAGAGIGLSQYLGIDDLITGLWLGAATFSLAMLTVKWLKGRYLIGCVFLYYGSLLGFLKYFHFIGHELNSIWGIDRLFLGVIVGSLVFYGAECGYKYLKNINGGRSYFPYQRVVMPVGLLVLLSVGVYWFL